MIICEITVEYKTTPRIYSEQGTNKKSALAALYELPARFVSDHLFNILAQTYLRLMLCHLWQDAMLYKITQNAANVHMLDM